MAVRHVLTYPHPTLKTACAPCGGIDEEVLAAARDLVETMRAHPRCVGLAAPQIGIPRRIVVVDVTGHPKATTCHGLMVIGDPVILEREGSEIGREGCLSLPDITADVRRAVRISVGGLAIEGGGAVETAGFEARVIQHEVDHLDGILILDRAASPSEIFPRRSGR
ncbi:MAG: peptide deformylase [Actinomycetota bacterium]